MNANIEIAKWLEFDAGTCFGAKLKHFGIILGIDSERRVAVVAVNATSQIEKLIYFADLHNIPEEDAMVDVTEDIHFSKPTGIDCHRPQEIPLEQLEIWFDEDKVRKTSYNEDVSPEKYHKILEIVLRSPLVTPAIKNIIRDSNQNL